MISEGRMPRPKREKDRVIWERLTLEAAFGDLAEDRPPNRFEVLMRKVRIALQCLARHDAQSEDAHQTLAQVSSHRSPRG